ncbi:MAG TPA: flagellar basal body rod protein FlgB [Syntrophomonadaceae bacterium]|nr:flagellar basal body rod protein FlgB [Syntrophomonadaceae bacterium]
MLEKIFSSGTLPILNKSMDAATLRDSVIADNIANVDTPGFKRTEVIFEEKLKKVLNDESNNVRLKLTDPRHFQVGGQYDGADLQPDLVHVTGESYRNDGNNVDIDVEMAKRTKNELYYDSLAQCMSKEIQLLRLAITGKG